MLQAADPAASKIWTSSAAANQLLGSQLATGSFQVLLHSCQSSAQLLKRVSQLNHVIYKPSSVGAASAHAPTAPRFMQVTNYDFNHDGRNDRITVQVGVSDMPSVVGVNILLEFSYKIEVSPDTPPCGCPGCKCTGMDRLSCHCLYLGLPTSVSKDDSTVAFASPSHGAMHFATACRQCARDISDQSGQGDVDRFAACRMVSTWSSKDLPT